MLWQVIINKKDSDQAPVTLTVDADSWYSALRSGLNEQGLKLNPISNLSCSINKGEGFVVEDTNANAVYELKQLNGQGSTGTATTSEPTSESTLYPETQELVLEVLPPDGARELILETTQPAQSEEPVQLQSDSQDSVMDTHEQVHTVIFSKDEAADDGSGIFYRERLVAVPEGTSKEEAGRLIMQYYEKLKDKGSFDGNKLFISIQIYDHEFEEQASKPAVAALTWKEWTPKKPQILFPLSGAKGVTFSKLPPPPTSDEEDKNTAITSTSMQADRTAPIEPVILAKPLELSTELMTTSSEPEVSKHEAAPIELSVEIKKKEPEPEVVKSTAGSAVEKKAPKKEEGQPQRRKGIESQGGEDKMVTAFDRMHDIFEVRDHDGAAAFALSLARELILSEAGSCMLISPGKYELYVSAAEGPTADAIKGTNLSLTKGIVGFATRTGVVVRVPDAQNDPRFNDEVDKKTGFHTRNLICTPIQHDGRIRGAMELVNSAAGFSQKDIDILSYIARALAEYIDTSLPSRQADFSEKEFLESSRPGVAKTGKNKASKKSTAGALGKSRSASSDAKTDSKTTVKTKSNEVAKSVSGNASGDKSGKAQSNRKKSNKKKGRRK